MDVIYSNMVFNEVPSLDLPFKESFRVLRPGGQMIFSVVHPSFFLYYYAQEQVGKENTKLIGAGGYFSGNDCAYMMGASSVTTPARGNKLKKDFAVEQKQKTIEQYFTALMQAGFQVRGLYEPQLNEELLKHSPEFIKYSDRPLALVLSAVKL